MQLPSSLVSVAESAVQNAQEVGYLQSWPNEVVEQFHYVSALSQFITETIHRDEALAQQLPAMLSELSRHQAYRTRLAALLAECPDEMSGHRVLRQFRNREMVYIAWKDFLHAWTLEESLRHLSQLAEAMIFETYQWQYKICCAEWGTPTNAEGEAQPMLIIGMGKLGGGELNFSSDIDLIFTTLKTAKPKVPAAVSPMRSSLLVLVSGSSKHSINRRLMVFVIASTCGCVRLEKAARW